MWPFSRHKNGSESRQALLDATKSLREVKDRDTEVHEVSTTLKAIRERNHFAEQLRTIMQGG
jgi:hypothetical protein